MGWVLVLDDDSLAGESLVIQLQSRRIRAVRARGGDEALQVLKSAPLAPIAVVVEPMLEDGSAMRFLDAISADPVLRHARPLILTRAQNPVIPGRAAMVFRKATDSDRLLLVVEALARNHGAQGVPALSAVVEQTPAGATGDKRVVFAGNVRLELDYTSDIVTDLRLSGRSDAREPSAILRPQFEKVIVEASQQHRGVRIHFEGLEYFNSSTLAFLIQAIHFARDKRVSLEVSYAESLKWQQVSFDALKRAMKMFERDESAPVVFVGLKVEALASTAS